VVCPSAAQKNIDGFRMKERDMKRKSRSAPLVVSWALCSLTALAFLFFLNSQLRADTKGKISGRVVDEKKEPVVGVSVQIVGTSLGAATDIDGYYTIINILPGTYELKFSAVGYTPLIVRGVSVEAGQTTTINAVMSEQAIQTKEIVVVAKRPVVDTRQTSAVSILDRSQISILPVQSLTDIVNLQAGVVEGHFRGGRLGEVQYQIDGVTVNNPYDNSSTMPLDRSVLQEVQVVSGTFDAEYGQAMSGVVNAVLKSGSEDHFDWNFETYVGDYFSPGDKRRIPINDKFMPTALQSYTLTLSGPTFIPKTTFMLNARRFTNQGYLFGQRRFVPTDSSDFERNIFHPTGDNKILPMAPDNEWSGALKVSNHLISSLQISYQILLNDQRYKTYNYMFWLNPDGEPMQRNLSITHGFDVTHTLSNNAFYTLSLRQNYFKYTNYVYENVFNPRYFQAGMPMGTLAYNLGVYVQGVDLTRFEQETNGIAFKGSYTDQILRNHLIKAGLEFQYSALSFGPPGTLVQATVNGVQKLQAFIDNPNYPGVQTYHPISFAAYLEDIAEWKEITVHAGARFESFDARTTVPSNLQNPANSIPGAPLSVPVRTSRKIDIAPRLGVSFPVIANGSVYFSYGHFYQMPGLSNLYSSANYTILKDLQAGSYNYGVGIMGNPDLRPEFTTQYEFGFKAELTDYLGVDLSLFYKDIRDLLGIQFISTYNDALYARYTNIDFGNVSGFTLSLIERNLGMVRARIDYTYQIAMGNSSDPMETFNRDQAGYDSRPVVQPLNWDQRHTLNATFSLVDPSSYSLTGIFRFQSGVPYTPQNLTVLGGQLEPNSGRKPSSLIADLLFEKYFSFVGARLSLFARIYNLFNTNFSNGFVFSSTGSVDYSLNPTGDMIALADPSRFYPPRRIEIGLSLRNP